MATRLSSNTASGVPVPWTMIVLTCQTKDSAQAYQKELETRQEKGFISKDTLLVVVEDPKQQVGSGGATLNALLVAAEHLGARRRLSVISPEILHNQKILIMHMGRNFPFDPCGRAFCALPLKVSSEGHADLLVCNIDLLLHTVTHKLAVNSPPGIWVCSTDMFLDIPDVVGADQFASYPVCAISVPASPQYAGSHGVYKLNNKNEIQDIIYKGSEEMLSELAGEDESVALVCGVLYFNVDVAEVLLPLHTQPPLDACTYMGLDSGATPIQLSMFFDILLAFCTAVTENDFILELQYHPAKHSNSPGQVSYDTHPVEVQARSQLWKALRQFAPAKCIHVPSGKHHYLNESSANFLQSVSELPITLEPSLPFAKHQVLRSTLSTGSSESSVYVNCVVRDPVKVGQGSLICHSHLVGHVAVGAKCIVSGLLPCDFKSVTTCNFPADAIIQGFSISLQGLGADSTSQRVLTAFGRRDDLLATVESETSTCMNESWEEFFGRTGVTKEDLWCQDTKPEDMCLLHARLFPVCHIQHSVGLQETLWLLGCHEDTDMLAKWRTSWRLSLSQILPAVNTSTEFEQRRKLFYKIGKVQVRETLLNQRAQGLSGLYWSACVDDYHQFMLAALDEVAQESDSAGIVARALASIADVLGNMAAGLGGMRSGPAANPRWTTAFQMLEAGDVKEGIRALATEREHWLDRPDLLVRAARHYEGAAQILIRHAVMTVRELISTSACKPSRMGKWVMGRCAARADLSGGWSDTPPITYEHGGAVVNVALQIDGQKPMGAKVRRIPKGELILHLGVTTITIKYLSQMSDYNQPHALGALLKAAIICAEIVQFPSEVRLEQQLKERHGGGFELETWSDLPHGSGLGTSSILAGVIMGVLWTASGRKYTSRDLIHAVLLLEQMLTTGGGWQDQVGGLVGGVKVGHSPPSLPLTVDVKLLDVSEETLEFLNQRLVLVYTGKTRLAKNLLQTVVRNWYARDPEIVATEDALVENAWQCAEALEKGDMTEVGKCLNEYWEQKKLMAPGCEPVVVTKMLSELRPHLLGASMAGAGGGGYLYLLMKEPLTVSIVQDVLFNIPGAENATVHRGTVDMDGLVIEIED